MDAAALVRVLAEPVRVKVFAALVLGANYTAHAAELAEVTVREAASAVYRLAEVGLVEITGERLVAKPEVFQRVVRSSAAPRPVDDLGYVDPKAAGVIGTFIRDGHLLRLPAQRSRRMLVLEEVAQAFEPGVDYSEARVNEVLTDMVDGGTVDHVSLRRYLVDEHLLRRQNGIYRRSGGRVDV